MKDSEKNPFDLFRLAIISALIIVFLLLTPQTFGELFIRLLTNVFDALLTFVSYVIYILWVVLICAFIMHFIRCSDKHCEDE